MSVSQFVAGLMLKSQPRYRCECGFPCYSEGQESYHRDGLCLAIRRVVNVMSARERCGVENHVGLDVNGIVLQQRLSL